MKDPRIENVVQLLFGASLDQLAPEAKEKTVAPHLSAALHPLKVLKPRGTGIDGSVRHPDDARQLPPVNQLGSLDLAIEYKLYRSRKKGAGEMDRGLGQSIAYAEQYQAVLLLVVYMERPRDSIPAHWLDRGVPLRVGHKAPGIPVYFAARPRSWNPPWANQFPH